MEMKHLNKNTQNGLSESQNGEINSLRMENKSLNSEEQEKKMMRMPRSNKYEKAIKAAVFKTEMSEEVKSAIDMMPLNNKLLGILSECGITGCIIHAIDKWGNILAHYKDVNEMPKDLQEGYQLFLEHRDCISVEIYTNTFCIIYCGGTVKIIDRDK